MSSEPGGTRSRTRARTESRTVSYLITQSEAVAWYIHEDLRRFVETQGVELSETLRIPYEERPDSNAVLLELLCDDIAHMLREGLVRRVHLLMYVDELDVTTAAFPLLYKATYEITLQPGLNSEGLQRKGGLLRPPELAAGKFAMLIDWHPDADPERRRRVRHPSYNLDWVKSERRYDPTTVVRYREGSLSAVGAEIVRRVEEAAPDSLRILERQ